MTDNENIKDIVENEEPIDETSTVFSTPAAHKDRKKAGKFALLILPIIATLVVALLASSIYFVVKYIAIPVEEKTTQFTPQNTLSYNPASLNKITVTNKYNTLVFNSNVVESNGESSQVWTLEGYDNSLIDSATINQLVSYAAAFQTFGEYAFDETADYGFASPLVKIDVESDTIEPYSLTIGNSTADSSYCYIRISSFPDKVYLLSSGIATSFLVQPLDLAISDAIPGVQQTDKNSKYFDQKGSLATFDSITLSGRKFKEPLVFTPNTDNRFSSYATYICTSPKLRVADKIDDIRALFEAGPAASKVVSFDQSAEKLKEFGLDNPLWRITMKLGSEKHTYLITPTDESNIDFYVASSTDRMIRVVTITNMQFLDNEESGFYFGFMALESIRDISEFSLKGEINTTFKLDYDTEESKYNITNGGKEVVAESFQTFYSQFIQITAINFDTQTISAAADLTITMKHHDGSKDTVVSFKKINDTRYQYYVGGIPMGQIPSSGYNIITREINKLIP